MTYHILEKEDEIKLKENYVNVFKNKYNLKSNVFLPRSKIKLPTYNNLERVIVFDLDETIGSFHHLIILWNSILQEKDQNMLNEILDLYPGKFRAGLSEIRFSQSDGNEIISNVSVDSSDEFIMRLNINQDTVPGNTIITGVAPNGSPVVSSRGTVDAVINPETFNPFRPGMIALTPGTRYLILEDINIDPNYGQPGYSGPTAWKNAFGVDSLQAYANDIIEWDGITWVVIFNSAAATDVIYITNSYTNTQYKFENKSWSKSYEGVYSALLWRLIL
jgi:hypothetical protein